MLFFSPFERFCPDSTPQSSSMGQCPYHSFLFSQIRVSPGPFTFHTEWSAQIAIIWIMCSIPTKDLMRIPRIVARVLCTSQDVAHSVSRESEMELLNEVSNALQTIPLCVESRFCLTPATVLQEPSCYRMPPICR